MYKNIVFPMLMLALVFATQNDSFAQVDKLKNKLKDAKKEVKEVKKDLPKETPEKSDDRGGGGREPQEAKPAGDPTSAGTAKGKTGPSNDKKETFDRYLTNQLFLVGRFYTNDERGAAICEFGKSTGGNIFSELENAKKFDRANFDSRVAEAKANGEYTAKEEKVKRVQAMLDDYDNFIGRSASTFADFFDDVNNDAKATPSEKITELDETEAFVNVVLHFSPNNPKAQSWLKAIEKERAKYGASMSAVAASDFHKKNMNKVVFSKKPLVIGQEAANDVSTNFASGDYIYATLYLDNPIKKRMSPASTSVGLNIRVDGESTTFDDRTRAWIDFEDLDKAYLQFALTPDEDWMTKYSQRYIEKGSPTFANINNGFGMKGPFEHEVELTITFPGVSDKVVGKFKLDLTEGPDFYANLGKKFHLEALGRIEIPKPAISNPKLEQEALQIC
ncbi:MAG: hypothetical protein MUC59_19575, partial [Saprospiraceae bacterium]|nr:hypothetical protein [Saprospiraceae bacterium]